MQSALTIFHFPTGLPCAPDMLKLRSPIVLRGIEGQICMPIEITRELGLEGRFAPPRIRGIQRLVKAYNSYSSHRDRTDWAKYYKAAPDYADWRVTINAAVLRIPTSNVRDELLEEIGKEVALSIHPWYLALRDWLEVLAHVDLGHEQKRDAHLDDFVVQDHSWVASTQIPHQRGHVFVNPIVKMFGYYDTHVRREDWQRAIRETNAQRVPPATHLMLRDARSALNRGAFRRCVLDSATAIEIMLTPLRDKILDNKVGETVRRAMVDKRDSITKKITALQSLGMARLDDLPESLFRLRNSVIHGGVNPTRVEAQKAYEAAACAIQEHAAL